MEKTVKERITEFIERMNIKITHFETLCGFSNGYLRNLKNNPGADKIAKILAAFPNLNREWLLYGEGTMLNSTLPLVSQTNRFGDNNYAAPGGSIVSRCPQCGGTTDPVEIQEAEIIEELRRPILPTEWSYQPNVDLLRKVRQQPDDIALSRVLTLDVPIDFWHIVRDESLMPDCKRGDMLALNAYPKDRAKPVPGKLHAVDTVSNGLIIRKLYYEDYGFRAVAPNKEFSDMRLEHEEIIRIYRIVCLARIAL